MLFSSHQHILYWGPPCGQHSGCFTHASSPDSPPFSGQEGSFISLSSQTGRLFSVLGPKCRLWGGGAGLQVTSYLPPALSLSPQQAGH